MHVYMIISITVSDAFIKQWKFSQYCYIIQSYCRLLFCGVHCSFGCFLLVSLFFIYLFGVLRRFQHCTGHITTGSWKGRGNQYIEFARVLYCKLPTNGKQLPAFTHKALTGIEPRPQRWEARVLPLCHRGPLLLVSEHLTHCYNKLHLFTFRAKSL